MFLASGICDAAVIRMSNKTIFLVLGSMKIQDVHVPIIKFALQARLQ